jgi:hypothetical protein
MFEEALNFGSVWIEFNYKRGDAPGERWQRHRQATWRLGDRKNGKEAAMDQTDPR